MIENKINPGDLAGKGVIGLDDVPSLSTGELQEKFEELVTAVVVPKHNALVAELDEQFATKAYVAQQVFLTGAADMTKSVYDTDGEGIVDDSQKLGGEPPEHYGKAPLRVSAALSAADWVGAGEFAVSTTVSGGTASVSGADFEAKVSHAVGTYTFTYADADAAWKENGAAVSLAEYGITLDGTPADADTITVVYTQTFPYTQEVALTGILATDAPHIAPVYSETLADAVAQKEAWAAVSEAEAGDGKIVFTCFENKPPVGIPLQAEVLR